MTQVLIHKKEDFVAMKKAGHLAAQALKMALDEAKVGVSTWHIHEVILHFAQKHDALAAPLFYHGFPASVCTSLNDVACHGIPDPQQILKDGDLLNIDVTLIKDGWHGDVNETILIGEHHSPESRHLVDVAREALERGIAVVKPGATLGDIGHTIECFVKDQNMSVVEEYCGHGIGRIFHDAPHVLHVGKKGEGMPLKKGMFFTIEPIVNLGKADVFLCKDGWTVQTKDHSLSAQFEHTIGVTDDGCILFTKNHQ